MPARAQASSVGQGHALRMPSHRRSLDHDPLQPTVGTCARQCSASAPQCPARADASWCTTLPQSACVCARASSAAQWPRLPQAPGAATEPLSGQQPASNGTTGTCAGHCRAEARQCPANPDASLVHRPTPPASVCAQASSAVLWRRPVHGTPHAPRRGPVNTTEPLLWSTCGS